jgi:hypothetical protein
LLSVYSILFEWVRYVRQFGLASRLPTDFPKTCAGLDVRDGRRHIRAGLISLSYLFYALKRRFEAEMADSAMDETLDDT